LTAETQKTPRRFLDHPMTRSPDGPIRKLLIFVHHRFEQWNAPDWFPSRLRQEFPQVTVVHLHDYKRVDEEIVDAEIAISWSIRPEQIPAAKKLRWIHSPAAAVHQLMFPELVNSDIILTNAREVHGPVVAEHVIALIFALAKKIRTRYDCRRSTFGGSRSFGTHSLVSGKLRAQPSAWWGSAVLDGRW
jgi:phosphoglycerate dehydrogenase-like enzyme